MDDGLPIRAADAEDEDEDEDEDESSPLPLTLPSASSFSASRMRSICAASALSDAGPVMISDSAMSGSISAL
jgi:hypothetical protein